MAVSFLLGVRVVCFDRNPSALACGLGNWSRLHIYHSQATASGHQTRRQKPHPGKSRDARPRTRQTLTRIGLSKRTGAVGRKRRGSDRCSCRVSRGRLPQQRERTASDYDPPGWHTARVYDTRTTAADGLLPGPAATASAGRRTVSRNARGRPNAASTSVCCLKKRVFICDSFVH